MEVWIRLKTVQVTEDDDVDSDILMAGSCVREDGVFALQYKDTDVTGFAGSTTEVRVCDDGVVLVQRHGDTLSGMTMEEGKKHFGLYRMPFGTITMGVLAHRVARSDEMSEQSGHVSMQYSIEINGAYVSENSILIEWNTDPAVVYRASIGEDGEDGEDGDKEEHS